MTHSLNDIPDSEVESDIADTEREIDVLELELRHLRFVVASKEIGITHRRDFIATLREMLAIRRGEA